MESFGTEKIRVIVSGGGTAGHIYPAVALVETLERGLGKENVEVLFVGAEGKMETKRIPELGYNIVALPVVGLQRRFTLKNLAFPFKLVASLARAVRIVSRFNPDVVVGLGGYASTPILKAAQLSDVPTILWEGNSYAGMANRVLAKKAKAVCVAYEGMERFFPKSEIAVTGNPIRGNFSKVERKSKEALKYFGLSGERPIVMVTGGSLGARVLNESVMVYIETIATEQKFDLIWQTGSSYFSEMQERTAHIEMANVWMQPFISRMDYAYSVADLVISRAGGSAIAELSLLGRAVVFVPSSQVAENHQYENAKSICSKGGALMVTDDRAVEELMPLAQEVVIDSARISQLEHKIKQFAYPDAATDIANIVLREAGKTKQFL